MSHYIRVRNGKMHPIQEQLGGFWDWAKDVSHTAISPFTKWLGDKLPSAPPNEGEVKVSTGPSLTTMLMVGGGIVAAVVLLKKKKR